MRELDFERALGEEKDWKPDLAPTQLIDEAFPCDADQEYADYLKGVTQAEISEPYADLITASKWRHGRRPLHIMPIGERVFYRALVNLLEDDLPKYERSGEAFDDFEQGPIVSDEVDFVIKADIANYFSSIDHELLSREIVNRSGRQEVAQVLSSFWRSLFDRGVGIPQMSEPSKLLAELLTENLHRSLIRRGLQVWRYADDFRIGVKTRSDCVSALDAMHEESRSLGLSLNDWKTHVLPIGRYTELINEPLEQENAARSSVVEDLTAWDPYSDTGSDIYIPDDEDVYVGAAVQLLSELASEEPDAVLEHSGLRERHRLIRKSIDILEFFQDDSGLPYVSEALTQEPQLTPAACRYMAAVAAKNPDSVRRTILEILTQSAPNKWQKIWLAWTLQVPSLELSNPNQEAEALKAFIMALLVDRSEFARSIALWTAARHRMLNKEQWAAVADSTRGLGAPYVAASLSGITGLSEADRKRLTPTSKLDALAAEWGARCIP
ncbi:reverse transcriptase domain-containing protein [Streptomyces sp. NPDC006365]|uniref:reverse transcriptase domain-containing protein n=1 Tax=Streptomyces sp. NPDC006365 TaxID=3364744 RepID=UPI0036BF816A